MAHASATSDAVVTCTRDGRTETHRAPYVILTVPLGVLQARSIDVQPPLPPRATAAIERLGFCLMNKVLLRFATPWWGEDVSSLHLLLSDSPVRHPFFLFNVPPAPHNDATLLGLITGAFAAEMEGLTDQQVSDAACDALRACGLHPPPPIHALVTRWQSDIYARGSWTFFAAGSSADDVHALAEPISCSLALAGEHTAIGAEGAGLDMGTVHGAWLTGYRAADHAKAALVARQRDERDGCGTQLLASSSSMQQQPAFSSSIQQPATQHVASNCGTPQPDTQQPASEIERRWQAWHVHQLVQAVGNPTTTIAGVGSLVCEASANESFAFTNFRIGQVVGWRRSFCMASWTNIDEEWGTEETGETACLAMVRASDPDVVSHVALLDVDAIGLRGFYERETGYRIVRVPYSCAATGEAGHALLCTACESDAHADTLWAAGGEMARHCAGSQLVADNLAQALRPSWPPVGALLLPAPGYLELCARAHHRAGLLDHLLDSTLVHDGRVLREYVSSRRDLIEIVERAKQGKPPTYPYIEL